MVRVITKDLARIHELIIESRGDSVELIILREPKALGTVVSAADLVQVLAEMTMFLLKHDTTVSPRDLSVDVIDAKVLRSIANSLRLQIATAIESAKKGEVNATESGRKYVDLLQRLAVLAREMLEIANTIEELLPKIREEAAEAYRKHLARA